ncbi:MAG: hypothetical protein BWY11_01239 [Firmicutes bacterium ADurb.Bin182]|nr:MAG: hypothetical protein BWY11_01239 [Firmicutes bacterium ADurb.Bin182]
MLKRRLLCIAGAALVCSGLLLFPSSSLAAPLPPNVEFMGLAERLVFFEDDDPFLSFAEVVPGDSVTRGFFVRNTSGVNAALFMKAEPVNDTDRALLERLNIKIALPHRGPSPEQVLYDGPVARMAESEPFGDFVQLGVGRDIDVELIVTLSVPADLTSEFMGRSAQFKWTFRAEDRSGPPFPTQPPHYPPFPPVTEIPGVKAPGTGDKSIAEAIRLPFAVLLVLLGLLFLVTVFKRKKEE